MRNRSALRGNPDEDPTVDQLVARLALRGRELPYEQRLRRVFDHAAVQHRAHDENIQKFNTGDPTFDPEWAPTLFEED